MSVININAWSDNKKIVIYTLGALNNTPIKGRLKIHKLLFLVSNVFKEQYGDIFDFKPDLWGPYSEKLYDALTFLQILGLIETKNHEYKLSKKGLDLYKCLKSNDLLVMNIMKDKLTQEGLDLYRSIKPDVDVLLKTIDDFKEFLNDLSDDEIFVFMYVSYPEYFGKVAEQDKLKNERVRVAISLLKKEKISFGKAVEISGLNSQEFDDLLRKKGIKYKKIEINDKI